jgi:hypothetical protein
MVGAVFFGFLAPRKLKKGIDPIRSFSKPMGVVVRVNLEVNL